MSKEEYVLSADVKSTFKTWYEAFRYAQKKKLWGKVTILQTKKDEYILVDKE